MFDYDGFLVKTLVKAGNMMIVSFLWLVSCIPIITVLPATAALFHTTTKVIRQSGKGVLSDFFGSFRSSLRKGIPLSLICIIIGLLLYTALDFGRQTWQEGILWTVYYIFGFFLTFIFLSLLLWIPPTLSRFESKVVATIWLSLYLASRNLIRTILFLILFGLVALLVYIYPITILIIPGLYCDLICGGMEKTLGAFIKERGLGDDDQAITGTNTSDEYLETDSTDAELNDMTGLELDRLLGEPDGEASNLGDNDE